MNATTSQPSTLHPPARLAAPARQADTPSGYLLIPERLIADMRRMAYAIGVYALIARRYFIEPTPVPLSNADLRAYDPALSYGQAFRALDHLVKEGWLIEDTSGRKHAYVPAWGRVAGEARPWQMDAPSLGRPRHVHTVRLDRRLLDLLLGQLVPHPHHPATVQRYFTAPPLTLGDVGAYAQGLTGVRVTAVRLARLGLLCDQRPVSLPTSDAAILARASQLPLLDPAGAALSERGITRLGFVVEAPVPEPIGQPIAFIPHDSITLLIGHVIAEPITFSTMDEGPNTAAACDISPLSAAISASTGNPGIQRDQKNPNPQPPRHTTDAAGGGVCVASRETPGDERERGDTPPSQESIPDSPTAVALRAIRVRPSVVRELADLPPDQVEAAIHEGRSRPDVRDLAGWVVARLRHGRDHGWPVAPPNAPDAAPDALCAAAADLAALATEAALTRALSASAAALPAPADETCVCDGSGEYVERVPYGHPLWGKVQFCPCRHRTRLTEHLTRSAGPVLAAASLVALQATERPYTPLTWSRRAFTPEEQAATLRHAVGRCAGAVEAPVRGVTLVGPPGSGKTTLAVATAKEIAARHGLTIRYTSAPKLLDDLRRERVEHAPAQVLTQLIEAPVLVLDDLGREQLTPFGRAQLYRLLDERMRRHTPESPRLTFITSNRSFAELYALDPALASRIAAHTEVTLCVASDYRLHAAAAPQERTP